MINMLNNLIRIAIVVVLLLIHSHAIALETAVFSGQVIDLDNKPVDKAEIFLYTTENIRRPADFISTATDTSGRFQITLPVGKYWAVARVRKGEKYGPLLPGDKHSGEPIVIEVVRDQVTEEIFTVVNLAESARLNKKTSGEFFKIKGKIIDSKGTPLTPAYATANREDLSPQIADYISAWTDDNGRYLLFLPAGTYYLGYARTFPPSRTNGSKKTITVTSHMEDVDIVVNELTINNRPSSKPIKEDN